MKKIILTALVAVATLSANAQFYVGGALGFQGKTNKVDDGKGGTTNETKSTFTIAPEVGYSINENWDAGIALNFQLKNKKQGNTIGGEIYGRYNYLKTGIATLFVELAAGFNADKKYYDKDGNAYKELDDKGNPKKDEKGNDIETSVSGSVFGIGFRPGVKIALSEKVSLVAKTGLIGAQFANDNAQTLGYDKTTFGIGVNNTDISLGVYYSF
ncbi:MAG: outer membrane beta-barrel protein [Bacteroidaceae bacterium]|nr:outer membrane beta-barrel protein [Bacteroidaceae bacterium]